MKAHGQPLAVRVQAPHATRPSLPLRAEWYRIARGPKRSFCRTDPQAGHVWIVVPPLATWTLDVVGLLVGQCAAQLLRVHGESVRDLYVTLQHHGQGYAERVRVDVQGDRRGLGVWIESRDLNDPTRAAIASVPAAARADGDGLSLAAWQDWVSDVMGRMHW